MYKEASSACASQTRVSYTDLLVKCLTKDIQRRRLRYIDIQLCVDPYTNFYTESRSSLCQSDRAPASVCFRLRTNSAGRPPQNDPERMPLRATAELAGRTDLLDVRVKLSFVAHCALWSKLDHSFRVWRTRCFFWLTPRGAQLGE